MFLISEQDPVYTYCVNVSETNRHDVGSKGRSSLWVSTSEDSYCVDPVLPDVHIRRAAFPGTRTETSLGCFKSDLMDVWV